MNQGKYVTLRKAAKQLGVCLATLRRWEADGKIGAIRTPGGQRRYCIEQYRQEDKPTVLYARVSSYSQKDDLARQTEFLLRAYPEGELVKEVGSGLNFKRRKFLSILESIYKGDVGCLVCAYPDRLVRFGFPLVEWICKTSKCKLVVLNERNLSPEQELVEDILSILHCFSARLYGLRRYKKQVQKTLQEKAPAHHQETIPKRDQEAAGVSI